MRTGFGIFATGGEFPAGEWWVRFGASYHLLADELCRASATIRELRPYFDRALAQAVATGVPATLSLICQDQTPTHYLARGDGRISGMVDIEAHLWAPSDYELATVELWARDPEVLRRGYERYRPWPASMDAVRPAYSFYTWMEWLRCTYTMMHDDQAAADLERCIAGRCRELMGV